MKNDGTKTNITQPPTSALEAALKKHGVDLNGNVYTVGVKDVMAYIEDELPHEYPELSNALQSLDQEELAIEIADAIGNIGFMEQVERVICETIRGQHAN